MAKTVTALAGAITANDWIVNVVNKAALRAGDNLVVGNESMKVLVADPALPAIVYRGNRGTAGLAAADGATATYGPPPDWGVSVGVTMLRDADPALQPFLAEVHAEREAEDLKEAEARADKAGKRGPKPDNTLPGTAEPKSK